LFSKTVRFDHVRLLKLPRFYRLSQQDITGRQPPTASRQPPAANRQPPTASRKPPAASRSFYNKISQAAGRWPELLKAKKDGSGH
jgi:hypothetical protein